MKRLTAKRPVLYMGRMYKAGETLPANDQKMVTAWLGAGSAEWTGEQSAAPEQAAEVTGGGQDAQDGANGAGDAQDTQDKNDAQDGQKTAQDGEMMEGNLDPVQLEGMNKDALLALAKDMGVELPRGATKALIIERLAAVPVQVPASEDNGGCPVMGAPTFKEQIAADISATFLNKLEFADTYLVNGREMAAMVDDNELLERDKARVLGAPMDGTYKARRLLYVAKADYGPRPAQNSMLTLGSNQYRVKSCTEEAGILAIELEAVRS